jgi:hypothetical protein
MTELKVDDLEDGKTYCSKLPNDTTWLLFGKVINNNIGLKQINYKRYDTDISNHTKNYSDLESTTFKLRDEELCYENIIKEGGRNKKKSLKR